MLDDLALGHAKICGQFGDLGARLATDPVVEARLWQGDILRCPFPFLSTARPECPLPLGIRHWHDVPRLSSLGFLL